MTNDNISKRVVIGHGNDGTTYPSFTIPICSMEGKTFVSIYVEGYETRVDSETNAFKHMESSGFFLHLSAAEQKALQGFDPQVHRLFAYGEHDVVAYEISRETEFYMAVLEDRTLAADPPFSRVKLANWTKNYDIIFRELKNVAKWYKGNYRTQEEVIRYYHETVSFLADVLPEIAQHLSRPGILEALLNV